MIRKIIACSILLLIVFAARAEQLPLQLPKQLEKMSLDEIFQISKSPKDNEDLFVQMLFSVPVEYHQYVMPMVANLYGVSEKTRMMPGIVEWRRKLPTRIAPQLQEYAKKYLRYLNPAFYPYLMPEMWPQKETKDHTSHSQFVSQAIQIGSDEELNRIFPPAIDPNSFLGQMLSDTYQIKEKKKTRPDLTQKDVASVVNVMTNLKNLEKGSKGRERTKILIMDFKDRKLLIEAHVNPCQSLISRLDKIEADKWFENQVKAENMSVAEFTEKCDAVIKAYRMDLAAPGVLRSIYYSVRESMKLPKDAYRRQISLALLRMFDTTKEDVDAVKEKKAELEKLFHEKILFLGTPVLLDF